MDRLYPVDELSPCCGAELIGKYRAKVISVEDALENYPMTTDDEIIDKIERALSALQ